MSATWLYARLEFNPCHGGKTQLIVYRHKSDADNDERFELLHFDLTNEQLTELLVNAKIKPKNMYT